MLPRRDARDCTKEFFLLKFFLCVPPPPVQDHATVSAQDCTAIATARGNIQNIELLLVCLSPCTGPHSNADIAPARRGFGNVGGGYV